LNYQPNERFQVVTRWQKEKDEYTTAEIEISAICCLALSLFSTENGIIFAVLEVSF